MSKPQAVAQNAGPLLGLKSTDRDRLVNSLKRFNLFLVCRPESEDRNNVLGENNELLSILRGLPVYEINRSKPDEEDEQRLMCVDDHPNAGQSSLRSAQLASDLENRLKKMVDKKINELREETNERFANMRDSDDFNEAVTEIIDCAGDNSEELMQRMQDIKDELEQRIERIDIFQPRAVYAFKFKNFTKFFGQNSDYLGSYFWVRGVPFCIHLQTTFERTGTPRTKRLGYYLECANTGDTTKWSIETVFKLIIIQEHPQLGTKHLTERYEKTFSYDSAKIGKPDFISFAVIIDPANGYIQNDAVKFRVDLVAEKMVRKV